MSTSRPSKLASFGRRHALRIAVYGALVGAPTAFALWPRGLDLRDGRHDRRRNGIWLGHGWIGDDAWFTINNKQDEKAGFRDPERVRALAERLAAHGVRDVFPHLCPALPDGSVMPVSGPATRTFLAAFTGQRVMPWIGGVFERSVHPDDAKWRSTFVAAAAKLLAEHPGLSGVHLNVEPLPSGHGGYLSLLDELREGIGDGKLLSVAAYPPPSLLHPHADVHWNESFTRAVASRCHQLVPMLYDTGLFLRRPYRGLVRAWTREVLAWAGSTEVLLGLPAYSDRGVGYHDPDVENLEESLLGVHEALTGYASLPEHYAGVALYSEWEMNDAKWETLSERFLAR